MKKITILTFILFLGLLISLPTTTTATTPVFTSEEEIDAYYDAQKQQNREEYEQKVQEVNDNLQKNLKANRDYYGQKILEVYQDDLGVNFQMWMADSYLQENNPDAEAIYSDIMKSPTIAGISKLKIVYFFNTDLFYKLNEVNQNKLTMHQARLAEIDKEIAKQQVPISEKKIATKENTKISNPEKEEVLMEITTSSEPTPIEIRNPEPVRKISWLRKILNWFK